MRELKHVLGRDIDEQIASIDGHLSSIYGKPRKEVTCVHFATPMFLCIEQSDVGLGYFTVAGTIQNLGIDLGSCTEGTELLLQMICGDTVKTLRYKVKKGRTIVADKITLDAYTKLQVSFTHPVISGLVGYTFTPDRGSNETATLPA